MRNAYHYLALLLILTSLCAGQQPSQGIPTTKARNSGGKTLPTYPDSTSGLEALMNDLTAVAGSGDKEALAPYLLSVVLPHPDEWFTAKFGDQRCKEPDLKADDCLGPRLALAYKAKAKILPSSLEVTLNDLIKEGLTNYEAVNYNSPCAAPIRIVSSPKLFGNLYTTPFLSPVLSGLVKNTEPIYVVWTFNQDKETTLGFFVYSEGSFRFLGMTHPASEEAWKEGRLSSKEESAILSASRYLSDEQLDVPNVAVAPSLVQRTVVLHIVVDKHGTPAEVSFVRGSDQFKEAAIQDAKKRKFDPPGFGPHGLHPSDFCLNWTP